MEPKKLLRGKATGTPTPTTPERRSLAGGPHSVTGASGKPPAPCVPALPSHPFSTIARTTGVTGRGVPAASAVPSAVNFHRKVPRLTGKRHSGKTLPAKLGAVASKLGCSRTQLARKALPAAVSSTERLNHHGGLIVGTGSGTVAPGATIVSPATSTGSNCDSSNDSGLGFERSGSNSKLAKHHHQAAPPPDQNGYGQAMASYQPAAPDAIAQYVAGVLDGPRQQQQQQPIANRMVTTSVSPLPQTLSSSTGSSSPSSISSSVSLAPSALANCTGRLPTTASGQGPGANGSSTGTTTSSSNSSNNSSTSTTNTNTPRNTTTNHRAAGVGSSSGSSLPFRLNVGGAEPPALASSTNRDGKIQLQIVTQPEQQHRARYQTEGSRGAVKDRSGNGFPVVRLVGYGKPAVLQVFIGTDLGRPSPHIFYQACKVSGKNSTPCVERKVEGTIFIEIQLKPEGNMTVTCDCVGILKERNVDVEHRFPDQTADSRTKKKSTRCRMVFRTVVTGDDGLEEMLQVCSQPIICTQPPGVPEICKKSLATCPAEGGLEMFIFGKNFLKDTRVVFQRRKVTATHSAFTRTGAPNETGWEQSVVPDKEYLQHTHLVCVVPPYDRQDIVEPATVKVYIVSSGKKSESHDFIYTPKGEHTTLSAATVSADCRMGQPPTTTQSNYLGELEAAIGAGASDAPASTFVSAILPGELPGVTGTATATGHFVCGGNRTEAVSPFDEVNTRDNCSLFLRSSTPLELAANGMMPPPINVLPSIGGTTSSVMGQQCHSVLGIGGGSEQQYSVALPSPQQQQQQPADAFKPELVEPECSRSNMTDEDSLDRFPGSTDNSLDGILFAQVSSGAGIMYRRRSVRQPSMDITEDSSSNMSLLANDSRMMEMPPGGGGGAGVGGSSGNSLSIGANLNTVMNIATMASLCGSGSMAMGTALMDTNYMGGESLGAPKSPLPVDCDLKQINLCIKSEPQQPQPQLPAGTPTNMELNQLLAVCNETIVTASRQIRAQLEADCILQQQQQQHQPQSQQQQQASLLDLPSLAVAGDAATVIETILHQQEVLLQPSGPSPTGGPSAIMAPALMHQHELALGAAPTVAVLPMATSQALAEATSGDTAMLTRAEETKQAVQDIIAATEMQKTINTLISSNTNSSSSSNTCNTSNSFKPSSSTNSCSNRSNFITTITTICISSSSSSSSSSINSSLSSSHSSSITNRSRPPIS
uniref:Nuclear factor of activated T-cells 5 n=1 Tax=Anopheles dirus TaxID=7168 RepID=A0A182N093_9DIPT